MAGTETVWGDTELFTVTVDAGDSVTVDGRRELVRVDEYLSAQYSLFLVPDFEPVASVNVSAKPVVVAGAGRTAVTFVGDGATVPATQVRTETGGANISAKARLTIANGTGAPVTMTVRVTIWAASRNPLTREHGQGPGDEGGARWLYR